MRRSPAIAVLCALSAALVTGCADDAPPVSQTGCVSTLQFFQDKVWGAFMADTCAGCHNAQGVARQTQLVLAGPGEPTYLSHNLQVLEKLAMIQVKGEPLLLRKARGELNHGGGVRLKPGSANYQALVQLLDRFDHPVVCNAPLAGSPLRNRMVLLDPQASFRRATLAIAGRLPRPDEEAALAKGGETALPGLVDALLEEPAFVATAQQWWDDKLLTGRYLGGNSATNLLDAKDYPQRHWYDDPVLEPDEALRKLGKQLVNDRLAREPLTLLGYILGQHKPLSELLVADYVVHDPLTARVYGVTQGFADPKNPDEFKPVHVAAGEQAGVLTSPIFLNRFPTTATNRNRHRSRIVHQLFLATNILKLGERPIDPTQVTDHTPTLFNPDCTVCHTVMEPVAGAFQNWDDKGRYRPPENGWYTDMFPPGFGEAKIPASEKGKSLQWLAKQIVADERFALAAVDVVLEGLLGRKPLLPPGKGDPGQAWQQAAWQFEQDERTAAAKAMRDHGLELRAAVKALLLSPIYRVGGLTASAKPADRQALALLGGDRLLTPEELDRKLQATVGANWPRWDGKSWLLYDLRLLYGGIDGNDVTERIRSGNGVMLAIARRMANEVACRQTAADFVRAREQRRLFPWVERTYAPEDANGFAIAAAQTAIRQNIVYLHQRLLGESLQAGDDEVERTWQVFYQTWKEGYTALKAGQKPAGSGEYLNWNCVAAKDPDSGATLDAAHKIDRDPDYVLRAWMAVLAYLLQDSKFLQQ